MSEVIDVKNIPIPNSVFTHNCQYRFVCGRPKTIESVLALGSAIGTQTIDGSHVGQGMISSNGEMSLVQYYFEETKWLLDWFAQRGLDSKGWEPGKNPEESSGDEGAIDIPLEDMELKPKEDTVIDFLDEHAIVSNQTEQKFREV